MNKHLFIEINRKEDSRYYSIHSGIRELKWIVEERFTDKKIKITSLKEIDPKKHILYGVDKASYEGGRIHFDDIRQIWEEDWEDE